MNESDTDCSLTGENCLTDKCTRETSKEFLGYLVVLGLCESSGVHVVVGIRMRL